MVRFVNDLPCAVGGDARQRRNAQSDLVKRGDYLVNTIMTCGNCHTPKGPPGGHRRQGFFRRPVAGMSRRSR